MAADPARVELAVLRAARAVRHAFNLRLREIGLSMTDAGMISFLAEHGSLTQRELAALLQITPAPCGVAIDGLVKRGLVERRADPSDGRVWRIVLTEAAAPAVREFERVDAELRADLRMGLARAERQQLARLLAVLEGNAIVAAGAGDDRAKRD
jgi:DNA-binding MarR family transcriptional regulator